MNILYIGKHYQKNNDDEGAITKSLEMYGCTVKRLNVTSLETDKKTMDGLYDFVLFHKIPLEYVQYLYGKQKLVLWYFDPLLKGFFAHDQYVNEVTKYTNWAFITDGDYVGWRNENRIVHMPQGFDDFDKEIDIQPQEKLPVLFIGHSHVIGYEKRHQYIQYISMSFPAMHWNQYSIFKDDLTNVCQSTKVMLGLPPVTNKYCSNRVYLLGGRGACLAHPRSKMLEEQFGDSIMFFGSAKDAVDKINYLLQNDNLRLKMRYKIRDIVMQSHCYHHRIKQILEYISE